MHGVHRSEGSAHLVGFSLDQLQRVGACLTPSMYLGPGSWSYLGDITNVFAFLFVYFGLYDTGFYFVALACGSLCSSGWPPTQNSPSGGITPILASFSVQLSEHVPGTRAWQSGKSLQLCCPVVYIPRR